MSAPTFHATVLIPTYNRASMLNETLTWLARIRVPNTVSWDVIVIDNNSTDETRKVVDRHAAAFPVPLRYLFEERQGRSSALNAGIAAARGVVLVFTDDDVRVAEGWLTPPSRRCSVSPTWPTPGVQCVRSGEPPAGVAGSDAR